MTVADIKEYIDERLIKYKDKAENYFTPVDNYYNTLFEIRSMLDELEPKAKWVKINEWDNGYTEYSCSKCKHTKSVLDTIELPPFCESCGARMNDEVEENNK